jgi:hypothetical protein
MFLRGKIDKSGFLSLERKGRWHLQYCPLQTGRMIRIPCGDWCPLFGEPEVYLTGPGDKGVSDISMCGGNNIILEYLIDERKPATDATGEEQ